MTDLRVQSLVGVVDPEVPGRVLKPSADGSMPVSGNLTVGGTVAIADPAQPTHVLRPEADGSMPITGNVTIEVGNVSIGGVFIEDEATGHTATVLASGLLTVDASGATVPISAVALPLPNLAATAANQATEITGLGNINTSLGLQAKLSDTQPVSLASIPNGNTTLLAGSQVIGHVIIDSGSVTVAGAVTVSSGNVTVAGAVTVSSGNIAISNFPASQAVTVTSGNVTVGGVVTISSGNIAISNTPSVTVASGNIAISNSPAVTVTSGNIAISNSPAVTVTSGNVAISNSPAVTVTSGNVTATVASTTISSGNLTVNNGSGASAVNVQDGGNSLTVDYATTGSGNATGALRVEIANNGTGLVGLNAGTQVIGHVIVDTAPVTHVIADSGTITTVSTVTAVTAITNALPAGSNVIGHVIVDSGAVTISGPVTVTSGNIAVSNFPASQAVTGTFFQPTQPVSAVSLPLPSNAAQETGGNLAALTTGQTIDDDSIRGALSNIAGLLEAIEFRLRELPLNLAVALNQTLNVNGGPIRFTSPESFESYANATAYQVNN